MQQLLWAALALASCGEVLAQAAPIQAGPSLNTRAVSGDKVPHNLFNLEDKAIIVVGGKPTTAGELKRQIESDLSRAAGAPTTFRGPARSVSARALVDAAVAKAEPPAASEVMSGPMRVPVIPPAGSIGATAKSPAIIGNMAANRNVATLIKGCTDLEPTVRRTREAAASGEQFTIDGSCLGDQAGTVELIGQFPGGALRPAFSEWKDGRIVVVMPSLRGVPDHTAALTVVRADRRRSSARQINFVAARERIEVPTGYWNPGGNIDETKVTEGGGNIFTGFHVTGTGGRIAGNFNIRVSPQCALDNLEVPSSAGRVVSVTGFEQGPLNEAAITVTYAPVCTTKTFDYVVGSDSTTWCHIAFQLRTWAYCPAGTQP